MTTIPLPSIAAPMSAVEFDLALAAARTKDHDARQFNRRWNWAVGGISSFIGAAILVTVMGSEQARALPLLPFLGNLLAMLLLVLFGVATAWEFMSRPDDHGARSEWYLRQNERRLSPVEMESLSGWIRNSPEVAALVSGWLAAGLEPRLSQCCALRAWASESFREAGHAEDLARLKAVTDGAARPATVGVLP